MDRAPVREVLARNLRALMKRHRELSTQKKLAEKARVAQTSISQILNLENEQMKSPKLDQVEKIANAFGLAAWQLLLDSKTVGHEMVELLTRPAVRDEDVRLKSWNAAAAKPKRSAWDGIERRQVVAKEQTQ